MNEERDDTTARWGHLPGYMKVAADVVSRRSSEGPVPVDPDVAEAMGAFEETALDADAALDSHFDGDDVDDGDMDLEWEEVADGEDKP